MADDYLGRKMEEYMARKASGQSNRRPLATLGRLLLKNRSHRGYDTGFVVREDQLRRMIEVNTRIPSARNQQVLRFRPVLADEAHKVLPHIRLGGALPALRLHLANNRNIHPQKARRGSRWSASAAAARARFLVRRNLPIRVTARRNADELQSPVCILRQTADVQRHTRAALPLPPAGEDSRQ